MPAASDLAKLCRTVEQAEGNSYVHCANGHGRSTMLVAMIMIRRGDRYTSSITFTVLLYFNFFAYTILL